MTKKTVLKVDISCEKCKKKVLLAISRLQGIDKIETDASSNTLTVTGDADPIDVIVCTRKAAGVAQVVSVGPPPKISESAKKSDQAIESKIIKAQSVTLGTPMAPVHVAWNMYPVSQQHMVVQEPEPSCSIM